MSQAEEQNDKQPEDKKAGPTRSFDGSTLGPASQMRPLRDRVWSNGLPDQYDLLTF